MKEEKIATRQSFGEELAKLGEENKNIVVLDADLAGATKTEIFGKKFPDRFFDLGIAEQDMVSTAAGLAASGKIPFASSFAMFLTGRAYDQIRNSICYPGANVKICATHAGITVGEDGATHQMIEDINLMRGIPKMMVLCTSDDVQTRWIVNAIAEYKGPCYLRLCRYASPVIYDKDTKFELGKAIMHGKGTKATVFATGVVVSEALKAQEELAKEGIDIRVVDVHTIKPIDREMIIKCAKETDKLISIEDHNIIGGLGSAIAEVLSEECPTKLVRMGMNDHFGRSGKAAQLLEYYGLVSSNIIEEVKKD